MPGLSANQVTLCEVLEVRGSPMHEDELWAVLYQSCDALKDIFLKGNTSHLQKILLSLNLDNVILCGSGKIKFGTNLDDKMPMDKRFIAPERFMTRPDEVNDLALEKMFIYTLGMVIYAGAQFGNGSVAELCLSSELETLLLYMCEDDPRCRCNLVQVFQACNSRKGIYLSVERIKSMVKSILGNEIPLEETSPISERLSSSVLRIYSPTLDYTHPLPLGPLQPLKPLNSTRMNDTPNVKDTRNETNRRIDRPSRSSKLQRYQSKDLEESEEFYEPLLKGPEKERDPKQVSIETPAPVTEETMSQAHVNPQESSLTDLPPINKTASMSRDNSKSGSMYATPNFKRLMTAEKRKLAKEGFYDENRSKIKVVDDRYKSMPALNSAEMESPRSGNNSIRSAEYPSNQQKATYRKLTRFASKDSMDSASLATSQYSSAMSLNYGSYTLDSQPEARRPFSYHGSSSYDGSAFNGFGSFERLTEPHAGGPEFVIFPNSSELSVIDITPARLGPMPRSRRRLSVMLPTAQRLETVIETSAIVKEVFDQVTEYLGLKETMYFGLTQIKENEYMFLDLESKLTKYAPSGWKDDKKNRIDFILHFKVKFFIENIRYLRQYKTRHLFYLQLRREILCGYMFCPDEAATALGSLALQAEFGDYVERYHGKCYFETEHYLPGRVLSRMTRSDIYHQLPLLHHSYRGLREDEAEVTFLKEAQKLKEYGMLFYQVSRSKKDQTDSILLAICIKGIVLFEVRGQIKTEIHRQLWHMIKKFSFSRKKFVVEPKKGIGLPVLTLYASSYKKAKYLLRMCQSFHRFSQLSQPRSFRTSDSGSINHSQKSSYSEENVDPQKEDRVPNVSRMDSSEIVAGKSDLAQKPQEANATFLGVNDDVRDKDEPKQPPPNPSKAGKSQGIQKGGGLGSPNILMTLSKDGEDEQILDQPFDEEFLKEYSPKTRRRLSTLGGVPEIMTNAILLRRYPGQGLGITIVGGEDSNRLGSGIFIKNIIAGGLAAKDGRLQKGDRILSVNGASLNRVSHDRAAEILKNAVGEVEIVVSQFKSHGTSFLDRTGLSMVDEDQSNTFTPTKAANSTQGAQGGKTEDIVMPLALSPIVAESPTTGNAQQPIGKSKKSSRLTRENVVVEDEISMQEVSVEESQIITKDNELSNSTPVGHKTMDGNNTEKEIFDTMEISLRKQGNSFGMNVTGGLGSPFDGIYVQSIEPNGAVDEDGRIQVGDCLLHVNGVDIRKVTHNQAVKVLQSAPVRSTFLISRALSRSLTELQVNHGKPPVDVSRMSGDESSRSSNASVKDTFIVKIDKGIGGLGLSLSGGVGSAPEFKDRIMVRRLFPGQPASACGKLRIGDIILAVNGSKVAGYTQQEAINLLRRTKQSVKLLVKRPHPKDIPEELLAETPRESLDPSSVLKNIQAKISEDAIRQVPEPPKNPDYSDVDQFSLDSYGHRKQGTDGEEIIPYPENIASLEVEPSIQKTSSPKHISAHEVLVHAQISGPRQKSTQSKNVGLLGNGNEIYHERPISPPDLTESPSAAHKETVEEPIIQEGVRESTFEHELSLPDLEELTGSSQGQLPGDSYVADSNNQDYSKHELSLPDLPSAEEMTGLKLPDPTSPDIQNMHVNPSNLQVPVKDHQSETSSITDPDISSEEEGILLEIDCSKKDGAAAGTAAGTSNEPSLSQPFSLGESDADSKQNRAESPLLISDSSAKQTSIQDFPAKQDEQNYVYFEVSLEKGDLGLGFLLHGGKSTTGGCFIQEVVSDPAKSCGKLQCGDEIVMVDSVDVRECEHMDAVELLRRTKGLVRLGIRREIKNQKSDVKVLGFEMVTLERDPTGRLGLTLGVEDGEIIVEDIVADEPAALNGNLRHGDIVKEINDLPLKDISLQDANVILNDANPIVQLAIQRKTHTSRQSKYAIDGSGRKLSTEKRAMSGDWTKPPLENGTKTLFPFARSDSWRSDSSVSSSPKKNSVTNSPVLKRLEVAQDSGVGLRLRKLSSQEDKGEIIIVQLERGPSGLGMRLTSHNDFGDKSGAFIANIIPGGTAAKTGKLRSGDKVISINGTNVEQKHQKEVVEILRSTNGKITLELFRYPVRFFSSMDRGSSIASSDCRDVNDLAEMDFHFVEEGSHGEYGALSDKLLSLLPISNVEDASERSDGKDTIQGGGEYENTTTRDDSNDLNGADNRDFDGVKAGNISPQSKRESGIRLDVDSQNDPVIGVNDQTLSHESFTSKNPADQGFDKSGQDLNVRYDDKDPSWNDSDISDEECSKLPPIDTNPGKTIIEKSSFSTSLIPKKTTTVEKVLGTGNGQETSFSSTLEKVTPSSSIVSSILDEVSPVNSSDEEVSDFDFSSSVLPDLSSFTIEDKEAFEKFHGQNWEKTEPIDGVNPKVDKVDGPVIAAEIRSDENGLEGIIVENEEKVITEPTQLDSGLVGTIVNQRTDSFANDVAGSYGSDTKRDSFLKDSDNDLNESFVEGLSSMEADASDVLMALDEFEIRKKEEFNDTLKGQIEGEPFHSETSFTVEKMGEEYAGRNESSFAKQSPAVERRSKIPIFDSKRPGASNSPSRRSPVRSGIPVFTAAKSKTDIELTEKATAKKGTSPVQLETAFTDWDNVATGTNKDVIDSSRFEVDIEVDGDSDNSFETDDDLALSLTRDTFSFGQEELDVKIAHFQTILNSDIIDREFMELKDMKSTDSCDVARRSANRDKNRFRSILPYDKTRVCLAGGEEKDYINASHIKFEVAGRSFHYIAAQGPLSNTVDDFWRMVWEQKVETILMVTKDVEGGKIKCHRYWPDLPGLSLKASDRFRVELVHRKESGNRIERQFSLINTKINKSFTINHLLFHAWPDAGLPKETLPFLMFAKHSAEVHTSGPLLVHCSAGTGRTGLFIVTDVLNKILPTDATVDVLTLVKSMKRQRQSLIQTKDQYIFCFKMAIEVLQEEKHLTY